MLVTDQWGRGIEEINDKREGDEEDESVDMRDEV